jgi:hypothetical protein
MLDTVMRRADIERDLAQAERALRQATANVERLRQILHYAARIGAPELIGLATTLLIKVEDNVALQLEIWDKLKLALSETAEVEGTTAA